MLEKYLRGECTPEEEKHVYHWFNINDASDYPPAVNEKEYGKKERMIWKGLGRRLQDAGMPGTVKRQVYLRLARYAAAAAVLLLLFLFAREQAWDRLWQKGTIYRTAAGEIKRFSLSDGTVVTLNALSSMNVPEDYGRRERHVYLEGEAYFLVQKDASQPFTVYSNTIATTALGTVFNVSAYPGEEATIVSLHEGKVSVNRTRGPEKKRQEMILEPGEEVVCSGDGKFVRQAFNRKERLSWKDQVLYFERADLQEVVHKLERYYGVEFEYGSLRGEEWKLTGEYRHVPLKNILESLVFNYGISYEIEEEKIILFREPN